MEEEYYFQIDDDFTDDRKFVLMILWIMARERSLRNYYRAMEKECRNRHLKLYCLLRNMINLYQKFRSILIGQRIVFGYIELPEKDRSLHGEYMRTMKRKKLF